MLRLNSNCAVYSGCCCAAERWFCFGGPRRHVTWTVVAARTHALTRTDARVPARARTSTRRHGREPRALPLSPCLDIPTRKYVYKHEYIYIHIRIYASIYARRGRHGGRTLRRSLAAAR